MAEQIYISSVKLRNFSDPVGGSRLINPPSGKKIFQATCFLQGFWVCAIASKEIKSVNMSSSVPIQAASASARAALSLTSTHGEIFSDAWITLGISAVITPI